MRNKNNIRKILQLLVLFLLMIQLPLLAGETIRVGVYENAPKIFTDNTGKASGFWADITNHIAEQENWDIEWVHGTWSECLERLEKNEIDILPDTGWTKERSNKYLFNEETVMLSWTRLYVAKNSNFQTIVNLDGKKIGALANSINLVGAEGLQEIVNKFEINCTIIEMNRNE